ncbi:MAG: hypothetical protein V3V97_19270, partial [Hyphomicrobiaceae bacterium]
ASDQLIIAGYCNRENSSAHVRCPRLWALAGENGDMSRERGFSGTWAGVPASAATTGMFWTAH